MRAFFDLNGLVLCITADDELLLAPMLEYLGELRIDAAPASDFEVWLKREGEQSPPADAQLICEGPLPNGEDSKSWVHDDAEWLNLPGKLSLAYSVKRRCATISVTPGRESLIGSFIGTAAIRAAVNSAGWTFVHSAALRVPQSERAILLFAGSGAGKTTTALALAVHGFGYMSDDITVLVPPQRRDDVTTIWGMPRLLRVHRFTKQLLPAIGPLLGDTWNTDDEQLLSRDTLKQVIEVCPPRPYPLGAIVYLGPRTEGPHLLNKLGKAETLTRFTALNIHRKQAGGLLDKDLIRFEAMGAAIASAMTLELRVGRDLDSLGERVRSALD